MDLLGLVYVSKALENFDDTSLEEIASFAAKQNDRFHITGYLYYEKGIFMQYVEGSKLNVLQLFSNIEKDSRHEVLNIQTNKTLIKRKFPLWKMRQLQKHELSQTNMEHILIDYMKHCTEVNNIALNEDIVWRIVDKLSKLRTLL